MDDYPITYGVMRHESQLNRDNTVTPLTVCQFWIGSFGPFWERIPTAEFSPAKLAERIEAMRATMRNLPR